MGFLAIMIDLSCNRVRQKRVKEKHKFTDKTNWDAINTQEHCQFPFCATFPAVTDVCLHLFE